MTTNAQQLNAQERVDAQELAFLRGLDGPFLAEIVGAKRFQRFVDAGHVRPTGDQYKGQPLYEAPFGV